jgi:hypothetical protein
MGYYNALLERKFQRVAGKKLKFISESYSEILVPEEEFGYLQHLKALLPLDSGGGDYPKPLLMLLQSSLCPVTLLFVIDQNVFRSLERSHGESFAEEWMEGSRAVGRSVLARASSLLQNEKIQVRSRILLGDCEETPVKLSRRFTLCIISRKYGNLDTSGSGISAAVSRIITQIDIPVVLY